MIVDSYRGTQNRYLRSPYKTLHHPNPLTKVSNHGSSVLFLVPAFDLPLPDSSSLAAVVMRSSSTTTGSVSRNSPTRRYNEEARGPWRRICRRYGSASSWGFVRIGRNGNETGGGASDEGCIGGNTAALREKRNSKDPPVGDSWSVQLIETV